MMAYVVEVGTHLPEPYHKVLRHIVGIGFAAR